MKKIKRILAILGAIILAGLYISTIVCALSSNENYMDMLMAFCLCNRDHPGADLGIFFCI